ncbi:hypothetical protein ACFW1P_22750 [Paenibacillus sp. NPDC058910]|uniref:hypothetical protein n=1 Tax=unclassified Paenibacillus TaxID=185978 RepID=UPI0036AA8E7D
MIHRLRHDFEPLRRTDDFIAYVSAADSVGGDSLTTSQLLRRCVSELGETAVPYIRQHLNDKLKEDTWLILETVLRDLGQL